MTTSVMTPQDRERTEQLDETIGLAVLWLGPLAAFVAALLWMW